MKVSVEETLAASNVTTALTTGPYLIYSEVLEGARRPRAFLEVVQEDFSLIGKDGNTIQVLKASQLSASQVSEATMLASGMSSADKTLSAVSLSVPDVIYSAVQLSDILKEDYSSIELTRLHLRNMGNAVMEYLDALVYTALAACTTVTHSVTTLDEVGVTNAMAKLENANWSVEGGRITPFLIVAPEAKALLLQDSTFVSTERYTTFEIANMVRGEIGKYCGCRVITTSYLDGKIYCFIVMPPNTGNGPVVLLAWKRPLQVKEEREEKYGYTYICTTIRANVAVVQADGVCRITQSTTP